MNTLQMSSILPIRFACDSIPDCQGQIVERIGSFVIIQGMATDSGYWFAKGVGGARRFGNRQEAVDYIEYAQDARPTDTRAPGSGPTDDLTNTKYGNKAPVKARDADYETARFASGTRAQKVFNSESEANKLAEQLKREGWKDVVVWHAASGWVARGMK